MNKGNIIDKINKVEVDINTVQKMAFIYNALEDGWQIKKKQDSYIFKKKHNNQREVFLDSYLDKFVNKNCEFKKIIN
jgi:hypothetical protein